MNKDLALRFLRVVNETGLNGWGQVYARMPFEAEEEARKGALFGAVFAKGESSPDKEAEMMVWVDEYYNSAERGGLLVDFWEKFEDKFKVVDSVWVWVTIELGKRKIRMVRNGESGIVIYRDASRVEVTGKSGMGRVITGDVEPGDEMLVWAGGLSEHLKELEDKKLDEEERVDGVVGKLIRDQVGAAGLVLRFGGMEMDEVIGKEEVVEEKTLGAVNTESWGSENLEEPENLYAEPELVSDRLVGPVKPKDRVVSWWKRISSRGRLTVGNRGGLDKKKRITIGLGLLFLILLSVSVVMGSVKIKNDREAAKWAAFAEPIEKKRLEAESSSKMNLVGSKKLLEEARAAFEEGKGDFIDTKFKNNLADLEMKLEQSWQTASGEKESELVNQINFDLIRQGFVGSKFSWSSDSNFLALDGALGVIARVETVQKEIKIIAGKGEGQEWLDLVPLGKNGFVLGRRGIGPISGEIKLTDFDSAVSDPVALGYFGSNLYLLDRGNREIYKYTVSGETLGERQRWLKQGEVIDLSTPVDLAIDGDVWLVGGSDKLERFRRGVKENYSLSGVPEGAVFSRVAVEREGDRVALLDKVHGWIIMFKKEDGSFVSQLNSGQFMEAGDIEFDGEGKLWVLAKGIMAEVK